MGRIRSATEKCLKDECGTHRSAIPENGVRGLREGQVEGIEVVVAAGGIRRRDRFAGGEIAAMDGLVVFENIEEAELQKICTADFLEPPCNFLGHRPIQYPREV
jgi:hypothetical protein